MLLGTIIRDTQIRAIKNAKKNILTTTLRASDASSDSPDPSGPRTQAPSRPTPSRLGRRTPLRLSRKTSTARRPYPWQDRRDGFHAAAGQGDNYSNHPGHCALTSFTVTYCLTVGREWGRLIGTTIWGHFPLLTACAANGHPLTKYVQNKCEMKITN